MKQPDDAAMIEEAQRLCDKYGFDQIVWMARRVGRSEEDPGWENVTTNGSDPLNKSIAASTGDYLKRKIALWDSGSWEAGIKGRILSFVRSRASEFQNEAERLNGLQSLETTQGAHFLMDLARVLRVRCDQYVQGFAIVSPEANRLLYGHEDGNDLPEEGT